MTNTRITDPEVLERRFPVMLRTFAIRRGSGGDGRFRGGDGALRIVQFMRPLTAGTPSSLHFCLQLSSTFAPLL